ncbi:ANTAR domain-containing protein [Rhodococcus rhodnii]|uniref:ANTAR domain-containing protein n=2 Tax=Rhodococcus rhodnii TaxID=38312 RepID=R7WHV1_9NOCA|nr:ANTAR domain-containing protein [Rhodococcus rhodnii]EOM74780.1 hypothetical protein Rrhod_3943 [Rhodococcus rhodnii LMG 5362]TXG89871.1 ANTAR domain-containing protein [Rhodococcus rhodnii]
MFDRDSTGPDALARVDAVGAALEGISRSLQNRPQVYKLMNDLCGQVVDTFPDAELAGITLLERPDRAETTAYTDAAVVEIDRHQYATGEGPTLDAPGLGRVVRASWSGAVRMWPAFTARATSPPVHSFLSAPLRIAAAGMVGSLNLYSLGDHGFSDLDAALLRVYTSSAENVLTVAHNAADAHAEIDGLRRAMQTRATIEQAKGILMALRSISADAAFEFLVEASQRENVKLATLAQRIVETMAEPVTE